MAVAHWRSDPGPPEPVWQAAHEGVRTSAVRYKRATLDHTYDAASLTSHGCD